MPTSDTSPHSRPLGELMPDGHLVMMVTTAIGDELTARPVTCLETSGARLSFLVSMGTDWVGDIAASRALVHVSSADDKHGTYLALQGTASISRDVDERHRLWNPIAGAWFDGPDDPDLAVLRFDVDSGEYWDGPGSAAGKIVGLVRAILGHDEAALGEKGTVEPRS
ncbi:MAG: pyridoxamine 5'-phosphate oxidase family protein [Acidimicrobiia bacterium]